MMPIEYRFACTLRNGLHARPASMIADLVGRFGSAVTLCKGGGPAIDARSVLSIVSLDVHLGDQCLFCVSGDDAESTSAALRELVEHRLQETDELGPAPGDAESDSAVRLPRALRRLGVAHVAGRAVCAGTGEGEAVILETLTLPLDLAGARRMPVDAELAAAHRALDAVAGELAARGDAARGIERDLLKAHAQIAGDPALWTHIESTIRGGSTAAHAVVSAADAFASRLRSASSRYIRDRVADVQDVAVQVMNRLAPGAIGFLPATLTRDSVLFAESLTPHQFLQLDRRWLKGLVLGQVGATSHTVILARSHRIPTLIDVFNPRGLAKHGQRVVVDGDGGYVITDVGPDVARYFEREQSTRDRRAVRLRASALGIARTIDGHQLEIAANASTEEEAAVAMETGADGVGLLRTELLFLERREAPSEDEQFRAYDAVLVAAGGKPVIVRTFDIGGDKPAPYLRLPPEDNPFLGVRGQRLHQRHESLLRGQLRAIAMVSGRHPGAVRVMAPMITTPDEADWFRRQVVLAQSDLAAAGKPFDPSMRTGIMIEVPAAALAMDRLAEHADFFSIGTNDLCQYWTAADRGNPGVAHLCNPLHPSFLRLLQTIVNGAKSAGRWIGVCGEMAGDPATLPLMIGLGLDEISIAPGESLSFKDALREADSVKCRELLARATMGRDATEVASLLRTERWRARSHVPLVGPDTITVDTDARDKEEAVKDAVDTLWVAGRTSAPRELEEAIWAREAVYSTGLGYGFAVPHCKSDAISSPSLAVVRLRDPVEWGSMDGEPVRVVLLLAVPADEQAGGGGAGHMKHLAKLARRLMHEGFRDRLRTATTAAAIEHCLREELGLE